MQIEWTPIALQGVYLTYERLWNLARETFAPVWCLSKVFYINKFNCKITAKDSIRKYSKSATSMGLRLKHGGFWDIWMCRASANDQSPDIPLKSHESWVTLSDQCGNHDFDVLNQSISVQGDPIIRRPNIRTSYSLHGSSQPLVFREHFRHIDCSQSVGIKIWCCKEICQTYATRDISWSRVGY